MGREKRGAAWVLLGLLPLLGLGVLLALIVSNGVGVGRSDAPPVEDLTVGRVTLPTENEIVLISETGTTFDAEVPVAVLTPGFSGETFSDYALIGFYVGVVPVTLGLLWYPFLRRLGTAGMNFVLALTVGLLVFLVLDTLLEAVEIAGELPGAFSGVPMVILVALLTMFGLLGVERLFRRGREGASRLATSYRIALGIGLHNLGEGLAIGAAFALGETALGVFLVIGFTLHNVTEGVGIAAPILRERPALRHFAWLAL